MNMKTLISISALFMALAIAASCSGKAPARAEAAPATFEERGAFSADSAMSYVRRQTGFGPRVPGSAAHAACRAWLVETLRRFGADTVQVLASETPAWDGSTLPVRNIFARFGAGRPARVLLLAHYDTRPWADRDPDPANRDKPIDGANDGASGVAVVLEIARNLQLRAPATGVDILLTDCEDYGAPDHARVADSEDTWALGARHFAENLPYGAADRPRFGILFDMVGGRGAVFHREYFSSLGAPEITDKVWGMAARLGLSSRFPDAQGGAITDDHVHLIRAGIPTVDIIESASPATGSFPPVWHTLSDNVSNIDPAAMSDAGRVALNVIYYEKP